MKYLLPALVFISLISCRKKEQEHIIQADAQENFAPYDTVAIDSFSSGATPNNVILTRRDTLVPKLDSAKAIQKTDEKLKADADKEKQLKAEKDKTATEAKKKEDKKKEATKAPKTETPKPENMPAEQPK